MVYLLVKSLHIVAAVLWIGSIVLVSFVTANSRMNEVQLGRAIRLTEASIGFTWLLGIILVVMGSWYMSAWWQIKVLLVVLISAIHTFIHRRWKRAATDGGNTAEPVWYVIMALTLVVVLLAVFKWPV